MSPLLKDLLDKVVKTKDHESRKQIIRVIYNVRRLEKEKAEKEN